MDSSVCASCLRVAQDILCDITVFNILRRLIVHRSLISDLSNPSSDTCHTHRLGWNRAGYPERTTKYSRRSDRLELLVFSHGPLLKLALFLTLLLRTEFWQIGLEKFFGLPAPSSAACRPTKSNPADSPLALTTRRAIAIYFYRLKCGVVCCSEGLARSDPA